MPGQPRSAPTITFYGNATNVVVNGSVTQTNLAFGLPIRQIRAYGSADAATNDFAYNGNGFLTQTIRYSGTSDPNVTNTFYYNERGQMVNKVDALGAVTFFDYDAMNRPIEQENFDEFGNALSWNFYYYTDNGELNWMDGPRLQSRRLRVLRLRRGGQAHHGNPLALGGQQRRHRRRSARRLQSLRPNVFINMTLSET